MHALFLTFEFPPYYGGGLSTYMDQTVRMLVKHNVSTSVIVSDSSVEFGTWKEETHHGANIIRVNPYENDVFKYMGHWSAFSYAFSDVVKKYIQKYGMPDWIETCDGFGIGYFTLQRKLTLEKYFKDLKIITTAHTPVSLIEEWNLEKKYVLPRYFYSEMEKFSLKAADCTISPSKFLIQELQENFDCKDVDFNHLPYGFENYRTQKQGNYTGEKEAGYMVASRVAFWKGIPHVVAGFDTYWKNGGGSVLKVFGSDTTSEIFGGSLTEHLKKKYSKHVECGKLQFLGLASPEDLIKQRETLYGQIHPSIKENFPFTVIENMSNGGLTLGSKSGGQAEMIEHGKSGFLFDTNKPESISESIFLADKLTPAERVSFSKEAKIRIETICDYKTIFERKMELVEKMQPAKTHFPFIRGKQLIFEKDLPSQPLLSVVVPHFNLGGYLQETIESALRSTYKNLEVIVVDDGSTDPASITLLSKLEAIYQRVKVVRQENSGVAEARNNGVKNANGSLIALLDADDLIDETYYEKTVAILCKYKNVGFAGSWNDDFNEEGRIRYWTTVNPEPPLQFLFNMTNCQGIVIRKEAFLAYGQHDKDLRMFLDDWESTVNMLAHGVRGVMLPHGLFKYRIRSGSVFRTHTGLWHHNYEKIVKKHLDAFKEYAGDMILFLNENGPNTFYHNPTYESALYAHTVSKPEDKKDQQDNSNGYLITKRTGRLARFVDNYYDYVELNPKGIKARQRYKFIIEPVAKWVNKKNTMKNNLDES